MSQVSPLDLTQNVRLEVEGDPVGLNNLVPNPDGVMGAWGWLTPLAGSNLTSAQFGLRLVTSVAQIAYAETVLAKVPTGHAYASARFDLGSVTSGANLKARLAFYDVNRVLLSTSAYSPANTTGNTTTYLAGTAIPVNTVYVTLQVAIQRASAAANAGDVAVFTNAMLTTATTNTFSTVRTNLIRNPSFEFDTTGWSLVNSPDGTQTLGRSTTSMVGTYSMTYSGGDASSPGPRSDQFPVTGGLAYSFSVYLRASGAASAGLQIIWYDSTGSVISSPSVASSVISTGSWTRYSMSVAAPTNATTARVKINVANSASTLYIDAAMVEQASTPGSYFDGSSTAPGHTYAWTGAPNGTPSTDTLSSYALASPIAWRNILNQSHEITVDRSALDVGTLQASVIDPLLDPAVSTTINPGRRCRVTAYDTASGTWQPLFTGRINDAQTSYDLDKTSGKFTTVITISATDNTTTMANAITPQGVGAISDLPLIIENAGLLVPWNCDGNNGEIQTATITSQNTNASLVDQVASTRDSVLGYAWVDRQNSLQAYSPDRMPVGTPTYLKGTFETAGDEAQWLAYQFASNTIGTTVARDTTNARTGTGCLKITSQGGLTTCGVTDSGPAPIIVGISSGTATLGSYAVVPGHAYTLSGWVKAGTAGRTVAAEIRWYAANGQSLTPVASGTATSLTTGYTNVGVTATAPVNAAFAFLSFTFSQAASGEIHYLDDVVFGENLLTYSRTGASAALTASYSDLDVSFSRDALINQLIVQYLRYNATTGVTSTINYGPYNAADSIDRYGVAQKTVTVQGISEGVTNLANYAASVLAKNSTPTRRPTSMTFPVKDNASLLHAVLWDLDHLINVAYDTPAQGTLLTGTYRITSITHHLSVDGTTQKWLTTYGFDPSGAVASPQPQPTTSGLVSATDGTWLAPTLQNGWVNYSGWEPSGYQRRNGVTYLRGLISSGTATSGTVLFTLPVGYRPSSDKHYVAASNGTWCILNVFANGDVRCNVGCSSGWLSLANLCFPAEQ